MIRNGHGHGHSTFPADTADILYKTNGKCYYTPPMEKRDNVIKVGADYGTAKFDC